MARYGDPLTSTISFANGDHVSIDRYQAANEQTNTAVSYQDESWKHRQSVDIARHQLQFKAQQLLKQTQMHQGSQTDAVPVNSRQPVLTPFFYRPLSIRMCRLQAVVPILSWRTCIPQINHFNRTIVQPRQDLRLSRSILLHDNSWYF